MVEPDWRGTLLRAPSSPDGRSLSDTFEFTNVVCQQGMEAGMLWMYERRGNRGWRDALVSECIDAIRSGEPLPHPVCKWFADVMQGKVKPPKKPKSGLKERHDRLRVAYAYRHAGSTLEEAFEQAANVFQCAYESVRRDWYAAQNKHQ